MWFFQSARKQTNIHWSNTLGHDNESNTIYKNKCQTFFIFYFVCDDLVSFLSAEILYHSLWFYCVCIYVNVFFALFSFTHKQYGSWWVLITFHAFTQRRPNNTSNQREKLILIILCKANWKMTRERRLIKKKF